MLVRTKTKKPKDSAIIKRALQDPLFSMKELTKGSLYMFMRFFWDTYSNEKFVENFHIKFLCKQLEKVARRVGNNEPKKHDLIFNVPPGTTKTATVSIFFPVWCWVNWYWMKFITTSHSSPLSLESAEYSRDIIRSDKFKLFFPEIDIKQDKDSKSNFRIVKKIQVAAGHLPQIKQGGGRVSTSVGASITGFHAHIIIPDDIIDPKKAVSVIGIKTANDYLDKTLSTRKVNKAVTVMVMIMQRLSKEDPTGHLLKKKGKKIKHICLPGEIDNYKEQVKPKKLIKRYQNNLLDPVRLSKEVLKELNADLGQYGYAGQIGQSPTPPTGGMFKVDHFQILTHTLNPVNYLETVRYWDKAGTKDGGAFSRGVKMSKLTNGRWIVSDVKGGQWATNERERIIKQTAIADGRDVTIGIEQEPGSGGKESAENTVKNLAGFVTFIEHPKGDKVYRADPYSVQVNDGNVLLLHADWNNDYIEEHRFFPFSKYKDQVDASSGAFNYMTAHKQVEVGV